MKASIVSQLTIFKSSLLEILSGGDEEYMATKDVEHDKSQIEGDLNAKTQDESESLSDIDDQEVINKFHASCIDFS